MFRLNSHVFSIGKQYILFYNFKRYHFFRNKSRVVLKSASDKALAGRYHLLTMPDILFFFFFSSSSFVSLLFISFLYFYIALK